MMTHPHTTLCVRCVRSVATNVSLHASVIVRLEKMR